MSKMDVVENSHDPQIVDQDKHRIDEKPESRLPIREEDPGVINRTWGGCQNNAEILVLLIV